MIFIRTNVGIRAHVFGRTRLYAMNNVRLSACLERVYNGDRRLLSRRWRHRHYAARVDYTVGIDMSCSWFLGGTRNVNWIFYLRRTQLFVFFISI